MNLGDIAGTELRARLRTMGLTLRVGPFSFRLISNIDSIADGLATLYPDYEVIAPSAFADFTIAVDSGRGLRRWFHQQAVFKFDGIEPFLPLPKTHAFPLLEWGMNWCISMHAHHFLILHSAVIERDGYAVIMPAPPGSGKSTLCAGLINRGWRLLSDELALISPADGTISPLGRPVSLKNESIDVIRRYVPNAVMNAVTTNTSKGSVTHLKVPSEHLARINEVAKPRWVIFPKFVRGSAAQLSPRSKAQSMLELGRNSFNYVILGREGFEVLSNVIDSSDCYDFQYSCLDDAVEAFDALLTQ